MSFPCWLYIDNHCQAEKVQEAFHLDSLRASHAIEVPVRNALEVDQIFDSISYSKGSSVIRMLSDHLGQETFLHGVAKYLKTHAYGNHSMQEYMQRHSG